MQSAKCKIDVSALPTIEKAFSSRGRQRGAVAILIIRGANTIIFNFQLSIFNFCVPGGDEKNVVYCNRVWYNEKKK